tara:strand:+ start:345 stop:533 length:189 start_codon:yes stop_codon:yes gene_type:complete
MGKNKDKTEEIERLIEESFRIMSDEFMYENFFEEEEEVDSYTGDPIDEKKDREKKKNEKKAE